VWRVSIVVLAVALQTACASGRYFPRGSLDGDPAWDRWTESWYSSHLRALDEDSICCSNRGRSYVVRFTLLRSFHHPVVLKAEELHGNWIFTTKIASGHGGYSPGRMTVNKSYKLTDDQVSRIKALVDAQSGFWTLAIDQNNPEIVIVDGAMWIVEVRHDDRYHFIHSQSGGVPESLPLRDIGQLFVSLASSDLGEIY
jgi:hypothetical protein